MTVTEALNQTSSLVARRDAETLLLHLLGRNRAWLLAHPEAEITDAQQLQLHALAARRAAREPLQYLTGEQEFYGLRLRVTSDTLIPRPETELLVEQVLLWATRLSGPPAMPALRIADIGTGSGAIAIALATHLPEARFFATDISPAALLVAQENAATHGCSDRITFACGDLLAAAPAQIVLDAVVSNPPYVPLTDASTLQPEVVGHEPHTALFAGDDGLALCRRLIPAAHAALRPNGLLALEFGFGQREALADLLSDWQDVRFLNDYAGIPRHAFATRP